MSLRRLAGAGAGAGAEVGPAAAAARCECKGVVVLELWKREAVGTGLESALGRGVVRVAAVLVDSRDAFASARKWR